MLATSYPRFPGDTIGTFMEPIAKGVAARGHEVHMVLPWHPRLERTGVDEGVHFHPFRYAPHPALNVFGYAGALARDTNLRWAAWAAAPFGIAASFAAASRVARDVGATIMHGHWLVPSGAVIAAAAGPLPVVISLHGSDVYVAERQAVVRPVARRALARMDALTACSDDLRDRTIALGADPARCETIPYGVDTKRFAPDPATRARVRQAAGLPADAEVVFTAGRFVSKKGFEYLIDATAEVARSRPALRLVLAGGGDLEAALRARVRDRGIVDRVSFPGVLDQGEVAAYLAAADVAAVPSVHDGRGNVDGLPNTVMESLASGTALVASRVAGIPSVVTDGDTGVLVPEKDTLALAAALARVLGDTPFRRALGDRARAAAVSRHSWAGVAERFEGAYARAASHRAALTPGSRVSGGR
jgi:glycosyltransferase involved in cell wall biosynthesis